MPAHAKILRSGSNPQGYALEELCELLADEVTEKNAGLRDDDRPVATVVRFNNRVIIRMLETIARTQRESMRALMEAEPRN